MIEIRILLLLLEIHFWFVDTKQCFVGSFAKIEPGPIFILWRMKVLEAVCKCVWHNVRSYLVFNINITFNGKMNLMQAFINDHEQSVNSLAV